MDGPDIAGALHDTMWLLIKLGAPLLVAALVTGLVISLIQAVTQINEPTLVFLPKLLVLGGVMVLLGPFMAQQLNGFALGLMDRLVALGGQ
jgi:flagellar biosynthetic protein FliQ